MQSMLKTFRKRISKFAAHPKLAAFSVGIVVQKATEAYRLFSEGKKPIEVAYGKRSINTK
jgi:hypothetical protein